MGMYGRMSRQQQRFFRQSLVLLIVVSLMTFVTGYLGHFPTGTELKALVKDVLGYFLTQNP